MQLEQTAEDKLFWENWELQKQKENEVSKVSYYTDEFTNTWKSNESTRKTAQDSFNGYIGIEGRQWDSASLDILRERKQPANTLNITKPNIDKVVGQLVNNPDIIKFTAINQDKNSQTNIIDSLYEYDSARGKYQKEINRFIKDVCIHTGVLEVFIDYTHETLGNIGLRALNRVTDIEYDTYWNSDNIKDCRYVFKSIWMTAREIKETFATKNEDIDRAINEYEVLRGVEEDAETRDQLASRTDIFYNNSNNRFRVIECSYMQKVPKTKQYSQKLKRFLDDNENPDIMRTQGDSVIPLPSFESICKIITFAPAISKGLILTEGDHHVQIGRLPYFIVSADKTMGVSQGLVTGILDAQSIYNKRTSMLTANQITSANGSLIVKDEYFKDATEAARFKDKRTSPGEVFTASSDQDLRDGIMPVPQGVMPEGLLQSIEQARTFVESYLNVNAAVSGRSEGANESGVLFESKRAQSQIAHVTINENISQTMLEFAECYFYLSKKVYSGAYRVLRNPKTGEKIEVNKRVLTEDFDVNSYLTEDKHVTYNEYLAGYITINEIDKLPRHDVIIKKSQLGLDQKQTALSTYNEMMNRSGNPILKTLFEKAMLPLVNIAEGNLEQMKAACDLFSEFQTAQIESQIITLKANNANALAQIRQIEQQQQQQMMPQQQQQGQQQPIVDDARSVANMAGMGNLATGIAEDNSGANNASNSDI